MKRVFSGLKPYSAMILLSIGLLFVQAFANLNLPSYMSDIVNIGIQQNGIEHASPSEISSDGLDFITAILPQEQSRFFRASYSFADDRYFINEGVDREELDALVGRSIIMLSSLSGGQGSIGGEMDEDFDITALYAYTPFLAQIPEEAKLAAYELALDYETAIVNQTGIVVAKMFYQELGKDITAMQLNFIFISGAKMMGITLIGMIASIAVAFVASRIGTGFSRTLRHQVFAKVESFASEEFNAFSSSSLVVRTSNDVMQVQQLIIMGIRMFVYAPIMGIGGILMIRQQGAELTWILVSAVAALLVLLIIIFSLALPKFKMMQTFVDRLNLVYRENLSGIMVIRAFGNHDYEDKRFNKANEDNANLSRFVNRLMGLMMPIMSFLMNITILAIIWFGGHMVATGSLQIGSMMAFMQYTMQVIMSFLMISMMFIFLPRATVSINRIAEVLDKENTIQDPDNPCSFIPEKMGEVRFENVDFKYGDADDAVLEDISFTALPGQTTAFIGSTGSGKSTLINLIPRFFDVSKGRILVNGVDVRELRQHDLHETIAYVPQKGMLLSGDVASNLRYGRQDASEEDLLKALDIAQSNFVLKTEEGLAMTIAQGGSNVSGGQRQRLSIARALATHAPIYIFDDSFSALDFKTDRDLRNALHKNLKDATLLIVAQRVNTIIDADQIVVLDEGRIVGIGTHRELLASCPTYYEIAASQLTQEELNHEYAR